MNNFNINSAISLDENQIDHYFRTKLENSYQDKQVKIRKPQNVDIIQSEPMESLFIPWKNLFSGLRLSKFNDFQPRVVQVDKEKVLWSARLNKDNYSVLIDQVFLFIERNLSDFYRFKFLAESEPSLDLKACITLLQRLFLNQTPYRLMPKIKIPDQKTCLKVFYKYFPETEFNFSNYNFEYSIQKTVDGFKFLEIGERGQIEKNFESLNLEEVQFFAFKVISMIDYDIEDQKFIFDYNQILFLDEFKEK